MRKANRSSVLPSIPYLGSCKFGEVVVGQSSASYSVLQLFIANFDGEFDTSAGASFYKPNSREFDQMFLACMSWLIGMVIRWVSIASAASTVSHSRRRI